MSSRSRWIQVLVTCLALASPLRADWIPDSQLGDAAGDQTSVALLSPFTTNDDPVSISGGTVSVVVPMEVLAGPTSASWWAVTWTPYPSQVSYDFSPSGSWAAGMPASSTDPTDAALQPHEDLLAASLNDSAGLLTLSATLRGLPFQASDRVQWSLDGPGTLSDTVNVYYSASGGRYFTYAGPSPYWGGTFQWSSGPYHDIRLARVQGVHSPTITLRLELATAPPATPSGPQGQPYYVWFFDADGDCATGWICVDSAVWLVYDKATSQWIARALQWSGGNMALIPDALLGHTISASAVEVTVSGTDLGLTDQYWWQAETGLVAGPVAGNWGLPLWGDWSDWTSWVHPHFLFNDGFEWGLSSWSGTQPPPSSLLAAARHREALLRRTQAGPPVLSLAPWQ